MCSAKAVGLGRLLPPVVVVDVSAQRGGIYTCAKREFLKSHGAAEHGVCLIFVGEAIPTPVRNDRLGLCQHLSIEDSPVPMTGLSINAPLYLVDARVVLPDESLTVCIH